MQIVVDAGAHLDAAEEAPWLEEIAGKSKRLLYDFYQRECRIFIKADLIDVFLTLARNGAAYAG